MARLSKWFALCFSKFIDSLSWVILIVGGIFLYFGLCLFPEESIPSRAFLALSDAFLVGGLIGFMTKSSVFIGAIMKELKNIIYGEGFLGKRNDILDIWGNVSEQMFENKFPEIHKGFLEVIKGYFPKDEISYYKDHVCDTDIKWENEDKDIMNVTDMVCFELIVKSPEEFVFPLRTWNNSKSLDDYKFTISDITVNGKETSVDSNTSLKNGEVCVTTSIKLKGQTKYRIKFKRTKIYSLRNDFYIAFSAKYIVDRFRVSLTHPENIKVLFISRGTQGDFEETTNTSTRIGKEYRGLILPKQGYIFALQKVNE